FHLPHSGLNNLTAVPPTRLRRAVEVSAVTADGKQENIVRTSPRSAMLIAVLAALSLAGCAATPELAPAEPAEPSVAVGEESTTTDGSDDDAAPAAGETTIPDGARAASPDFPFPVPEDWAELDPFVEEKLGKDITMAGSVEYPGDAKAAAKHYQELLIAAGFDAYPYGPGELTNQASIAAEGTVNGELRIAIIN